MEVTKRFVDTGGRLSTSRLRTTILLLPACAMITATKWQRPSGSSRAPGRDAALRDWIQVRRQLAVTGMGGGKFRREGSSRAALMSRALHIRNRGRLRGWLIDLAEGRSSAFVTGNREAEAFDESLKLGGCFTSAHRRGPEDAGNARSAAQCPDAARVKPQGLQRSARDPKQFCRRCCRRAGSRNRGRNSSNG